MGNVFTTPVPDRPQIPGGKTRICVAGFGVSPHTGRAYHIASMIAKKYGDKYETWFYFSTFGFGTFLNETLKPEIPDDQKSKEGTKDKGKTIAEHTSSPFVWLETYNSDEKKNVVTDAIGGRDMFSDWVVENFSDDAELKDLAENYTPTVSESFFDNTVPAGTYLGSS